MNLVLGLLVTIAVTAVAVTAMLLVRRRAPEGSYFKDGDRASGVFGALATGFALLLGFIIFLSFSSYDSARSGAETEAKVAAQQVLTAQFFSGDVPEELTGQLVCYGRSVAGAEWKALNQGTLGDSVNPWGVEMYKTVSTVDPKTYPEQSAYDRWMDQTSVRELARNDRVHGAEGVMPLPLWLALLVISGVVFTYLLFFADPAEGPVTQGVLMGSVTMVMTLLLLLLVFFDHPHGGGIGRLKPTAMEQTLVVMDEQRAAMGVAVDPPCDDEGNPR